MEFLRVVLQTEKIRVQGLYCTLKHALSSSAPIDEDDALRLLHVLQAAAQSFQMSDVDVPAMAQMDTERLLHVCKKSRKLLHKPAAVLLDALLPDEAVPIGDGLDLSPVHKEVLK